MRNILSLSLQTMRSRLGSYRACLLFFSLTLFPTLSTWAQEFYQFNGDPDQIVIDNRLLNSPSESAGLVEIQRLTNTAAGASPESIRVYRFQSEYSKYEGGGRLSVRIAAEVSRGDEASKVTPIAIAFDDGPWIYDLVRDAGQDKRLLALARTILAGTPLKGFDLPLDLQGYSPGDILR